MKNTIVRTLVALSLTAVLSPVALMAQRPLTAAIPFDFTVGTKSFAAGNYRVQELAQGVLQIRNLKDNSIAMAIAIPAQKMGKADTGVLTFNRYGDRCFLSRVSDDSRGWLLAPSRAEKELIAKSASPKPVVVAADSHAK
jgi:hypothetical protein